MRAAVIKAFTYAAAAVALYRVYKTISKLSQSKHAIVVSGASRLPPTPRSLFGRYFQSERTSLWVFQREWFPVGLTTDQLRGVVYIMHGFGEHSGRYDCVAAALTAMGLVVLAIDHQGHGQSEGDRAHVERFDDYIADAKQFIRMKESEYDSALPRFLLGHSMGGAIAAQTAQETADVWTGGVILSGPALMGDPKVATPFMRTLAGIMSNLLPKLGVDSLSSSLVSSDAAVVQNYDSDPLNYHGPMRARWGAEILSTMDKIMAEAASFHLPLLLLHGDDDSIASVEGSRTFFSSVSSTDKTIIVYPKMYHEIFNEDGGTAATRDLCEWVSGKL